MDLSVKGALREVKRGERFRNQATREELVLHHERLSLLLEYYARKWDSVPSPVKESLDFTNQMQAQLQKLIKEVDSRTNS